MSSKAEQARNLAAQFSVGQQTEQTPEPARRPVARTKRVRRTVDLSPARHHALKEWCGEVAVQLGVADVSGQDVLSALVGLLLSDETTARKVRAEMEEGLEQK